MMYGGRTENDKITGRFREKILQILGFAVDSLAELELARDDSRVI
jgi:hypothetical protein